MFFKIIEHMPIDIQLSLSLILFNDLRSVSKINVFIRKKIKEYI